MNGAAFHAHTAPSLKDLGDQRVRPEGAFFGKQLGEFLFMCDNARRAKSARDEILEFAQNAYEAGADLAH